MRKAAARTGLISLMLAGGLLSAGISQAQDIGVGDTSERAAELTAAVGGPAPADHLIAFTADKAAVDVRPDDVADMQATDPASATMGKVADAGAPAAASSTVDEARPAADIQRVASAAPPARAR